MIREPAEFNIKQCHFVYYLKNYSVLKFHKVFFSQEKISLQKKIPYIKIQHWTFITDIYKHYTCDTNAIADL